MKTALLVLLTGLSGLVFSCGESGNNKENTVAKADSIRAAKKETERLKKRKAIDERLSIDSVYLDRALKKAIEIAENKNAEKFKEEYSETVPDSTYNVELSICSDFFFTKEKPHLIIRRKSPGTIYIDIFSKKGNRFHKVASHEEWDLTYVSDTIRDINGDGLKDFVVNWYGSSGCCLKAFSNVYLLRPDKTFTDSFEFINPTFSPKEKIIRGVCYGHPGETEMYKYKWDGVKVDTIEYVSYEISDKGEKTGKIVIWAKYPSGNKGQKIKVLNSIPSEYMKIGGYDWFTDNLDE